MLEAIRERAQGWLAKVILGLLLIPFALWGIDSYFHGGGDAGQIAKIDGAVVTEHDFQNALQGRLRAERERLAKSASSANLDTPELRKKVLEDLITRQLVLQAALEEGFKGNDSGVTQFIAGIPAFQENGKFSKTRYEVMLRSQNMSPQQFEVGLRQDMILRQFESAYAGSSLVSKTTAAQFAQMAERQIEVSYITYAAAPFRNKVSVDDATIRSTYENSKDRYTEPERVKVEYIVLSQDLLAQHASVSEQDARNYYDSHLGEFREAERRSASHILIAAPKDDVKAREAARKKAEELLSEVRAHPDRFAEIARKTSQDTGSAEKGGDLGSFPRGVMVKPFEDAVFSMQVNEIRGPVETEYGYHIIRLNSVMPGTQIGFEVVKDDILHNLRHQQAVQRFADAAEQFSNLVYEQPDSLKSAADALSLSPHNSDWITREVATGPLNNPKFREAVFSPDVLKDKHNTEAIEVAPGVLVAARVIEYQPSRVKSLSEVEANIRKQLIQARALEMAKSAGEAALAAVQTGKEPGPAWSPFSRVSLSRESGLSGALLEKLFKSATGNLPSYVGDLDPTIGYLLYRVSRIIDPPQPGSEKIEAYRRGLSQAISQAELHAWNTYLRSQADIKINQDKLKKTEE
jgi:peptidyl-prolyl cis-trans isomerase D